MNRPIFITITLILLLINWSCKKETNEFSGYLQIELVSKYLDDSKSHPQLRSTELSNVKLEVAENSNYNIDIKLELVKIEGKKKIYRSNELLYGNYHISFQASFFDWIDYEVNGTEQTTRNYSKYFQIIPDKTKTIEIEL